MESFALTVIDISEETPAIRALRLARPEGRPLPSWEPGAHLKVHMPFGGERCYSLVNDTADPRAGIDPASYRIGVRLDAAGQGGSAFMHALRRDDRVTVAGPDNDFPLEPESGEVVLLAGGIGVTPILSMAAALSAAGRSYRFIFAGRRRAEMAFLTEAQAIAGERLAIHADDEAGGLFDVAGLVRRLVAGERLYVCGPRPMIDAAIAAAKTERWEAGRLRFELFSAAAPVPDDGAFEVMLKSSGARYQVPRDKSILEVLIEAGVDPLHDCKRGECGICQVAVLEGVPDHRDYVLSDAERAANKLMQICVSRSKTPLLVLDL